MTWEPRGCSVSACNVLLMLRESMSFSWHFSVSVSSAQLAKPWYNRTTYLRHFSILQYCYAVCADYKKVLGETWESSDLCEILFQQRIQFTKNST